MYLQPKESPALVRTSLRGLLVVDQGTTLALELRWGLAPVPGVLAKDTRGSSILDLLLLGPRW